MRAIPTKRAKVPRSYNEIAKIAEQAVLEKSHELIGNAQRECIVQYTAALLYTLAINYGWGAKRAARLLESIDSTYSDMDGVGFAKGYQPTDLIDWVRDHLGIDLEERVQTRSDFV